jgi:5'-deoxynucleotidase YfbR-like HD superfamily hydrolase
MRDVSHNEVIRSIAMAGRVNRYHTWPVIRPQSVGEHTHRVMLIYLQLFGIPRAEVLVYILQHDLGEIFAGDTPFYAKRKVPALKEAVNVAEIEGLDKLGLCQPALTPEEWKQFKIADLLEMYEYGQIELRMGNQYGDIVSRNIIVALEDMLPFEQIDVYRRKLWPREVT